MSLLADVTYRKQRRRRAKLTVIQADLLKPYLGPALRSWISDGEEIRTPVVSRAGDVEEIEPVITIGPLLAKARGGTLSVSVPRMHLDAMLEAVTEEGKSDVDVHAEVGLSDADKKGALQVTQPNETDRGERKP